MVRRRTTLTTMTMTLTFLMTMTAVLWTTTTTALIVRENTVFPKLGEVSLSRSSWRLTLITDLGVYDKFAHQTIRYIRKVENQVASTYDKFADAGLVQFTPHIKALKEELNHRLGVDLNYGKFMKEELMEFSSHFMSMKDGLGFMNRTKNKIKEQLANYESLHDTAKSRILRHRRALIPILGKVMHFLYGVTTDSDLRDIRQAINELGENQKTLQHVSQRSLSIMNKSQHEVSLNRQRINKLNQGLGELSKELKQFASKTEDHVVALAKFVDYYLTLDSLAQNAQELVIEMVQHMEDLERQIDTLAGGDLSPGVIAPNKLKEALLEIAEKLPPTLRLPIDPTRNLWSFYQAIRCSTVFMDNKIVMLLNIPLINAVEMMEIYEVINLPLPDLKLTKPVKGKEKPWVAFYEVETTAIAIDPARTKYSLLSKDEARRCARNIEGFCQFINPIYPTNKNKFCVIALFLGNKQLIDKTCVTKVRTNSILPVARHVSEGDWIVALGKPLMFTITCDQNSPQLAQTKELLPPIDTLKLGHGCVAFSTDVVLPSYHEFSSVLDVSPELTMNFGEVNFTIWHPIHELVSDKIHIWNMTDLETIEEINMNDLIKKIENIKTVHIPLHPLWTHKDIVIGIISTAVLVTGVAIIIYKCYCSKALGPTTIINRTAKQLVTTPPEIEPLQNNLVVDDIKETQKVKEILRNPYYNLYPAISYE